MLPAKSFILFIAKIVKKFSFLLLAIVLASTFSALVGSLGIFSLAPVVELFLKTDVKSSSIITQYFVETFQKLGIPVTAISFLVVFLVMLIIKNALLTFTRYVIARTQFAVMRSLVNETYTMFFKARWHFFSSNRQGVLLNTLNNQISNVGGAFAAVGDLFSGLLRTMFYLAIPFMICWQATLVSLILGVLISIPLQFLAGIGYHLGKKITRATNDYLDVLHETLSAAKLILGFGNYHKHTPEVDHRFYQYRTAMVKSQILGNVLHFLYEPLLVGVLLVTLYLTFYRYAVPISEALVMYYAFYNLMQLLGQMNHTYHIILNRFPSYEQVDHLQSLARQHVQPTGTHPFIELKEAIVLQNIWFSYPNQPPVLQDMNVVISKGKMTAFVGGSGVGKTTLLDLILGFYEPDQGTVIIDDIPLQEYDIWSFRRRLGFVPQDTILFNTSIRENLLWGNDKATQQEVDEICKLANAYDFIMDLSDGYDTVVGDRGVRLSGGQRQRIALARAVLRKPELLLLDEATSSLDSQSERLIQEAIEKIAKETTVVVIAHRLSTIIRADHIYVLDKGSIVGEGTFNELLESNRVFNRMVELQKLEST